ncbi:MAG: glucose 1-dehydrogenase [Ilumatobacteraceae bacterium]|jgi:NAD(P)-dependent dehydrogenase (short-subunit alcohol dehydrogenase family)|nr:glucose 1-dehydrogenase [Ilumatobacteraceae bacterium]MDP4702138.1 glucose 1-dehydrogenase [Ilumatobacteraceae bacterium]
MAGRLEGKVAVITGGASGIGAGTVERFIAEGARCVIADIQVDAGAAFAQKFGNKAIFVKTDVANENEVEAVVAAAVKHFGRIDCMFNNAGILGAVGPVTEIPGDAWSRSIDVLLSSVFYGIKHAAKAMIASGNGGNIINTTSTAGLRAGLGPHVYTAAKHGVVGLTQSTSTELGPLGIRVNAIAPGGTVSGLTAWLVTGSSDNLTDANSKIGVSNPMRRAGQPADIANAALFLASDEASYVNGHVLVVDGAGEVIGDRNHRFVQLGSQIVQETGRIGL